MCIRAGMVPLWWWQLHDAGGIDGPVRFVYTRKSFSDTRLADEEIAAYFMQLYDGSDTKQHLNKSNEG